MLEYVRNTFAAEAKFPKKDDDVEVWTTNLYLSASGGKFPEHLHVNSSSGGSKREVLKLVCWIGTYPSREPLAIAAMDAWGKRCDAFYIMSTATSSFSASGGDHPWKEERLSETTSLVRLEAPEDSGSLWLRTRLAMAFVREKHWDFDFVLKADDDTFLFEGNLRRFLRAFDSREVLYLGHPLHS